MSGWAAYGGGAGHYDAVDEAGPDGDTTYLYATDQGATDLLSGIALPATVGPIVAVQLTSQARKVACGTKRLQHRFKSGGLEGNGSKVFQPGVTYQPCQEACETNPATGAAWNPTAANALQFGPRVHT